MMSVFMLQINFVRLTRSMLFVALLCSCTPEDENSNSEGQAAGQQGPITTPGLNGLDGVSLNLGGAPGTPEIQENQFDVSDFDTPTEWQGLAPDEETEDEQDSEMDGVQEEQSDQIAP